MRITLQQVPHPVRLLVTIALLVALLGSIRWLHESFPAYTDAVSNISANDITLNECIPHLGRYANAFACNSGLPRTKWDAPALTTPARFVHHPVQEASLSDQTVPEIFLDPNPYVAFLPADVKPNYALWETRLQQHAKQRIEYLTTMRPEVLMPDADFFEQESNNTLAAGNLITDFGTGAGKESAIDIIGALSQNDNVDYFRVELTAGDIIGVNLTGGAKELALYDSAGQLLVRSAKDASIVLPLTSPLPGGGQASLYYVINQSGTYVLGVTQRSDGQ